jgi:hypothetical protein
LGLDANLQSTTSGTPGNPSGLWDSGVQDSGFMFSHTFPGIVTDLAPGSYTAVVRGVNGTTGVGLVEGYDIP